MTLAANIISLPNLIPKNYKKFIRYYGNIAASI
jgi:hypothetical protein